MKSKGNVLLIVLLLVALAAAVIVGYLYWQTTQIPTNKVRSIVTPKPTPAFLIHTDSNAGYSFEYSSELIKKVTESRGFDSIILSKNEWLDAVVNINSFDAKGIDFNKWVSEYINDFDLKNASISHSSQGTSPPGNPNSYEFSLFDFENNDTKNHSYFVFLLKPDKSVIVELSALNYGDKTAAVRSNFNNIFSSFKFINQ